MILERRAFYNILKSAWCFVTTCVYFTTSQCIYKPLVQQIENMPLPSFYLGSEINKPCNSPFLYLDSLPANEANDGILLTNLLWGLNKIKHTKCLEGGMILVTDQKCYFFQYQTYLRKNLITDEHNYKIFNSECGYSPSWILISLGFLRLLLLSYSVVSDTLQPHRRQPTRLLCPWDSPGKNTGVGCHFLLQRHYYITIK